MPGDPALHVPAQAPAMAERELPELRLDAGRCGMTMGQRIRVLRESRHMSLRDLSTACGVSKAYLVGVENDRKENLTIKTIDRIAGALGAQPAWVAYGVVPTASSGDAQQGRKDEPEESR